MLDGCSLLHARVTADGRRDVLMAEDPSHDLVAAGVLSQIDVADQVPKLMPGHTHAKNTDRGRRNLFGQHARPLVTLALARE